VTVQACTIIARNYVAAARVLASSFHDHHPDGQFTALVLDDFDNLINASDEPFKILRLDEIGIEPKEMFRMAGIYSVTELSTAVKPWLLRTLLAKGATTAIYLDPDIEVYASLDELADLALHHGIVLTPHITSALTRDGLSKSETEILESGIYNLGFIALGPSAEGFLEFWMERLRRECIVDPSHMRFVDQRWVDFVPGLFPVHVCADTSYNVAYWNLGQRLLDFDGQRYVVDGKPLRFFHFSGYDPRIPHFLSKHQGARPRILLSQYPIVRRICDEYASTLISNGYDETISLSYGFERQANGVPYDVVMRQLYRDALITAESAEERLAAQLPPNPFDRFESDAFLSWLNELTDGGDGGRISRFLSATHASRPDLQRAFPDPTGVDFEQFALWSHNEVAQGRLDEHLDVTAANGPADVATHSHSSNKNADLLPGIRVAGYFRAETGVGEQGRLALAAAQYAGIATSTYVDTTSASRQEHDFEETQRSDLNVNLVCVNADELPHFADRVGPSFFACRYTIGLWAWEIEEFPTQFSRSFDYVDEVWASSEFARSAIAAKTSKPVISYPIPILAPKVVAADLRSDFGIPSRYCFLFCFDLTSIPARKNPLGLIEAFSRAFRPNEGPVLVIKAVNGERRVADLEELRLAVMERDDVYLIDRYVDAKTNTALMASCNCYVSLHRSEGFGLTLAEAMALGKPVIATGYSGNLEFMTDDTSYLVPSTEGTVPFGCEPYPEGARWAEPDLDAAARFMRHVYENPEEAGAVGARAREHVLSHHGLNARVGVLTERFAHAQDVLARQQANSGFRSRPSLFMHLRRSPR
jgi:glycosyltransferase involved in cell wall biosynthesis